MKATTANAADKRRATNTPAPSFVLITAKYNRENIFARSTGLAFELKGLNDGTDDDGVCREWMFEDYGGHAGAKHSRPVLAPEDALTLLDSYLHTRHEELLQARDGWMGGEHRLLKAKGVRLGGGVGRQLGRHDGVELGASQGEARGARDGHAAPCQPWEGCQAAIDGERDLLLRQLHPQLA